MISLFISSGRLPTRNRDTRHTPLSRFVPRRFQLPIAVQATARRQMLLISSVKHTYDVQLAVRRRIFSISNAWFSPRKTDRWNGIFMRNKSSFFEIKSGFEFLSSNIFARSRAPLSAFFVLNAVFLSLEIDFFVFFFFVKKGKEEFYYASLALWMCESDVLIVTNIRHGWSTPIQME